MGPFHRRESPTQTCADALLQVSSQEIWGRTPRGGYTPTVKAYAGPIAGKRGVEFLTDIDPQPYGSPLEARWYLGRTVGVALRVKNGEDFACIAAFVTSYQPELCVP